MPPVDNKIVGRVRKSLHALGREEETKAETQEVLKLHKTFSLNKYINRLPAKDSEFIEPYVEALRKAGLPE